MTLSGHPASAIGEALENATRTLALRDFLEALRLIVQADGPLDQVRALWAQLSQRQYDESDCLEFCRFIERLDIFPHKYPVHPADQFGPQYGEEMDEERFEALCAYMSSGVARRDAQREVDAIANDPKSDYWYFLPGHQFGDYLQNFFPENDPGAVIGGYMKAIFPLRSYAGIDGIYTPRDQLLPVNEDGVRQLLADVGCGVAQKWPLLAEILQYTLDARRIEADDNGWWVWTLVARFLPPPLLVAFVRALKRKNPPGLVGAPVMCLYEVLKELMPYVPETILEINWSEDLETIETKIASNELLEDGRSGSISNEQRETLALASAMRGLLNKVAEFPGIYDELREAANDEIEMSFPVALVGELLFDDPNPIGVLLFEDVADSGLRDEFGKSLFECFRRIRCESPAPMRSPLTIEHTADLSIRLLHRGGIGHDDLALNLAQFAQTFWPGHDFFPTAWVQEDPRGAIVDTADDRSDLFLNCYDAAANEGFDELASSILAFFLASQAVNFDGHIGQFARVGRAIDKELKGPRRALIRQACKVALKAAEKNSQTELERKFLKPFLGRDVRLKEAQIVPFTLARTRAEAEKWLSKQLDAERWMAFQSSTRELFVDAELSWANLHRELGNGLKSWSSVALAYILPIENELRERLMPFYRSTGFERYCREHDKPAPKQPTLGNLVFFVFQHKEYDQDLRALLEDCVSKLPNERSVKSRLNELVQFRNAAAHARSFRAEKFLAVRKMLFQDGLVTDLMDCLTQAT